jgi:hypothetical protein
LLNSPNLGSIKGSRVDIGIFFSLLVSPYFPIVPFVLIHYFPTLTFPPSSVTLFSINRIISAVSAVVRLSLARPPQHPRTSEEKEYREL